MWPVERTQADPPKSTFLCINTEQADNAKRSIPSQGTNIHQNKLCPLDYNILPGKEVTKIWGLE